MSKTFTKIKENLLIEKNISPPHIAIIGLGYVGLPLTIEFSKKYTVTGYDISEQKITELKNNMDTTKELSDDQLKNSSAQFTTNLNDIKSANIKILTVPTPIDSNKKPDLTLLKSATTTISHLLNKGDIIIYESTVYPGTTEEICMPILEKNSGLVFNKDFFIGYSPERISPGEKNRTLTKIQKVVSGSTPETLEIVARLYESIIPAGVYKAQTIKVAEAAKVIENTQRDLNVALMNELSIIFNKMDINTQHVIDAASTKWNFIKMSPGLVGGHCIGVDPYYLTYKAEQLGYSPEVILAGRRINDNMGKYVAELTIKNLIKANKHVKNARIGILGITFKENVSDIRNSKVMDVINELYDYDVQILVHDPQACPITTQQDLNITLQPWESLTNLDALIIAVPHKEFKTINTTELLNKINGNDDSKVIMDIKGLFSDTPSIKNNSLYKAL